MEIIKLKFTLFERQNIFSIPQKFANRIKEVIEEVLDEGALDSVNDLNEWKTESLFKTLTEIVSYGKNLIIHDVGR